MSGRKIVGIGILIVVLSVFGVSQLQAQSTLTLEGLSSRVTTLARRVTALSSNKADKDAVRALETRVSALETELGTSKPTSTPTRRRPTATATRPRPTSTPTRVRPTATPTPGKAFITITRNMNVRSGPNTTYAVIGYATIGQKYDITGKNGDDSWWRIEFQGQNAWIYAPYVTSNNAGNVRVVPTPTPETNSVAEESTLNTPVEMPRAMLYAAYVWPVGTAIDEILVSFTVDNDVELVGAHGLYFIACTGFSIAGDNAYFGLQTDVRDPARGNLGKGVIFSRWYENNETADVRLADTRVPESGWTEAGDYERNFVSVRGRYQWGGGDYTIKVAAQEADNVGQWYGLWVIDGNGKETWIGSLRFSPGARIDPACYSTVQVYGGPPLKPADIPYWKVSVNPPTGNGIPAALEDTWYPENVESLRNALITVNGARVTFEVGLAYIAHD